MSGTHTRATIESLIDVAEELVKFSPAAMELSRLAADEDVAMDGLAAALEREPSVATQMLRIANSAAFRRGEATASLDRAILLIGRRQLSQLAFAMACMDGMASLDCGLMRVQTLIRDGLLLGNLARELSRLAPGARDMAFVAGMLHSIGSAVMSYAAPEQTQRALQTSLDLDLPLYRAEHEVFGFDHAELGGAMARRWDFPAPLALAIEYQYRPLEAPDCTETVAVVAIASALLDRLLGEQDDSEEADDRLDELLDALSMREAFDRAGIDPARLWQRVHEVAA